MLRVSSRGDMNQLQGLRCACGVPALASCCPLHRPTMRQGTAVPWWLPLGLVLHNPVLAVLSVVLEQELGAGRWQLLDTGSRAGLGSRTAAMPQVYCPMACSI